MNDGHVLGSQGVLNGVPLRLVQTTWRVTGLGRSIEPRSRFAKQHITQFSQSIAGSTGRSLQRELHSPTRDFVVAGDQVERVIVVFEKVLRDDFDRAITYRSDKSANLVLLDVLHNHRRARSKAMRRQRGSLGLGAELADHAASQGRPLFVQLDSFEHAFFLLAIGQTLRLFLGFQRHPSAEVLEQRGPLDLVWLEEGIDFRQILAKGLRGPLRAVFRDFDAGLTADQIDRADFFTGNVRFFNQQLEELVSIGPRRKSP